MPTQSLVFTALPNGFTADGKSLRLSVLVSIRLDAGNDAAVLRTFPDFASWPKTLAGAAFSLRAGSTTFRLGAQHVDRTIATPDDATWRALFPSTTPVRAFALRDRSGDTVVSYGTVAMNKLVAGLYGKIAASATDELPPMGALVKDKDILAVTDIVAKLDRTFWNQKTKQRDTALLLARYRENRLEDIDSADAPLAAFSLFHTPPTAATTETVTPRDDDRLEVSWQSHKRAEFSEAKAVAGVDFHQIVAAMNQYPTLLRKLGLVLDFIVPRTAVPQGTDLLLSVVANLKAKPSLPGLPGLPGTGGPARPTIGPKVASPATHTVHSATAFAAVPRPSSSEEDLRVSRGLLDMDPKRFALLQADVDGAGHKLLNYARTLTAHLEPERQVDPTTKLPRRAGAPALRNSGLMLVHSRRGDALMGSFKRGKTLDDALRQQLVLRTAPAPALFAEDLVRGWRIDVWDGVSAKWRSLCERLADYEIAKGAIRLAGLREEGLVRLAATSAADGTNPDVVYLHEAVAVWNGWSLVAQQPGRAIDPDDKKLRDSAAHVPAGIPLRSTFTVVPGSLPRLRYGRRYAMRARAVDLAGNSLPPSPSSYAGDEASIAAAAPYLRFEPVQPPTLALVGDGQSTPTPTEGESMARVAIRTRNAQFDDPAPSSEEHLRWAVSARTSQREAELHGVLDAPGWGSPQQFALLETRDKELPTKTVASPVDADPLKATPTTYATLPAGTSMLPYLPDPLCTHVAVRVLNMPLVPLAPIVIPMYEDGSRWPDAAPILVRVYEGPGHVPRFEEATRILHIPVPKAVRATVRIASMLSAESLKLMGVWNWIPDADRTPALRRRAEHGGLWPLTPWREIEVVNAVQRPLLQPAMPKLQLGRGSRDTFVVPTAMAICHRNSTDRVDLHAAWHDPRDTGTAPADLSKKAVPFSIRITDPLGYAGVTEHVMPEPDQPNLIAFGSVKKTVGADDRLCEPKTHDFGDTRYRRVEYHLVGTTRFREYMPFEVLHAGSAPTAPETDANITLPGPVTRAWALSSAPPPAPEVLYVVPTFGWTRGTDSEGKRTSWRRGGGLRVWLDRPWNATGYGEMLGVVIPPAGASIEPNDPPYKGTVTQWGNDPAWKSPWVNGVAPRVTNFPLARTRPDPTGAWLPPGAPATEADQPFESFSTTSLAHPGLPPFAPTGRVDVAPHDVFWDAERRLWYCDIEITHGASYFPFVRLALARYQPGSLHDAYLSNIVLADFSALAPDRWLSVTRTSGTLRQVRVFGNRPEQSSGFSEAHAARLQDIAQDGQIVPIPTGISKTNIVEVWVEKLTASQGEDFGWHKVADGKEGAGSTEVRPQAETTGSGTVTRPPVTRPPVTRPPVAGQTMRREQASAAQASAAQATRAAELMARRDFTGIVSESLLDATMEWPTMWSGTVELPTAPSAGARYRVVVAEYEEHLTDGANPYQNALAAKARRLVFVEHVELA